MDLESQLRRWTPRGPSPRLEAQLFGRGRTAPGRAEPFLAARLWFGPAAAAALMLAILPLSLRHGAAGPDRGGALLAASNPAPSSVSLKSAVVAVNLWHAATLASTNR